ncbi:MAG: hypothetical protein BWY91_00364 [bacterium ADurb.BinA028]|jgi:hypothetical protein|nr:MAG: hypothetical protein BWY91_00364 [bacterium ADurb.BinA028]
MTPAQHATTAAAEVAFTSPIYVEVELAALRAQGHAILAGKTGTGSNYTSAEAALVNATVSTANRRAEAHRAIAYALLAT